MKNTSALFIIDDVIANRLMELEDEHISHQVLHEESFHKHLIDIQAVSYTHLYRIFRINGMYSQ